MAKSFRINNRNGKWKVDAIYTEGWFGRERCEDGWYECERSFESCEDAESYMNERQKNI